MSEHETVVREPVERQPVGRQPMGRKIGEIRPWIIEPGTNRYAEGSVLIKAGHTHVLCTASVETTVPSWLAGKGKGWISAEYSMLPRATHTRSKRDREKVSGRTQEIQRLIGRALRSVVDLSKLGERSILVDCDVIQADGGTRTASITGGCVALGLAISRLIAEGKVPPGTWIDTVAAVSVGLKNKNVLVDLDYEEDSSCDVDMNFVRLGQGGFVELQGTGEQAPFSKLDLDRMTDGATVVLDQIRETQLAAFRSASVVW